MKATQKDFAAIAPKAARQARVFFFCGPDESAASHAADRIVSLLDNPGERVELAGGDVRRDPVLLGDEARSTSLFGDTRHIIVRAAGDEAHDAIANLLSGEAEPCPVLVVATGTTDKGRTAKLLADRPDALVAMFYPPDLRAIADTIRKSADAAGVKLDDELAARIARASSLDIRLALNEVTKLALYLDAAPERPRKATAADYEAIGAAHEEDGFAALVDVVLGGQAGRFPAELRRMREMDLNPVGVLLAFERRAAQLAQLAGKLGGRGGDVGALLEAEKAARRVFWKDVPELARQLELWRGPRLERLVERLMALHQQLLANSHESGLLLSHGMARILREAMKASRKDRRQGFR